MPTFVLMLGVLAGRLCLALARGVIHVLLLPARTALAIAPTMARPRRVLVAGALGSMALLAVAAYLLGRAR
jgi:hypothetical protein